MYVQRIVVWHNSFYGVKGVKGVLVGEGVVKGVKEVKGVKDDRLSSDG
jgi:hypothetical protein